MRTTLALEYTYPYGIVNSVWAAYRRYGWLPDRFLLGTDDPEGPAAQEIFAMVGAMLRAYGSPAEIRHVRLDLDDFEGMKATLSQAIHDEQGRGHEVAAEVTSGRTLPKLALYHAALQEQPEKVFYLDVHDYDYRPLPYPLTPGRIHNCKDLTLEDVMDA